MLTCKFGKWYELNPQRARANNSVVVLRHKVKERTFKQLWERIRAAGTGEPGIYFSNDYNSGVNPCNEASLEALSFCNLTTINADDITQQEDLDQRARIAAFIGTLQAAYTNFHFLRDGWEETTIRDSLLGVSMTGIASGGVLKLDLKQAAGIVIQENQRVADIIGIPVAKRTTLVKPEGTSSLVLGTSSGIHSWHSRYYIRRLRFNKEEPIYRYLKRALPNLIEDDVLKPGTDAVLSIPVKAPEGAIFRDEGPLNLLVRVKKLHDEWIKPGHRDGHNTHNVSCSVSIKPDEWDTVGEWMWDNRESYNGISTFPHDPINYEQTPFEECSQETYQQLSAELRNIDLSKISEEEDNTKLKEEVACAAGACTITHV